MNPSNGVPVYLFQNCKEYDISQWNNKPNEKSYVCDSFTIKDCNEKNGNVLTTQCTPGNIFPGVIPGKSFLNGNMAYVSFTKTSEDQQSTVTEVLNTIPLGNYKDENGQIYKAVRAFQR